MINLHLDEDADAHALVNGLRLRGWDVTSSRERTLLQCSDEEQPLWATEETRVIFTDNAADFCRIHSSFVRRSRRHAGIIIADQQTVSIGEEIRRLLRIGAAKSAIEMETQLEFLSNWK